MILLSYEQMKDPLKLHSKVDFDLLEQCCVVMKSFKDVSTFMCSQNVVTASLTKPLLHSLMTKSKPQQVKDIHQAKATLYNDLEKRYVCSSILYYNVEIKSA